MTIRTIRRRCRKIPTNNKINNWDEVWAECGYDRVVTASLRQLRKLNTDSLLRCFEDMADRKRLPESLFVCYDDLEKARSDATHDLRRYLWKIRNSTKDTKKDRKAIKKPEQRKVIVGGLIRAADTWMLISGGDKEDRRIRKNSSCCYPYDAIPQKKPCGVLFAHIAVSAYEENLRVYPAVQATLIGNGSVCVSPGMFEEEREVYESVRAFTEFLRKHPEFQRDIGDISVLL